MTWSLIRRIVDGLVLTGGVSNPFTSSSFVAQRVPRHRGAFIGSFGFNPNITSGTVYFEARLNPGEPWARVFEGGTDLADLVSADAALYFSKGRSFGNSDIPILPEMRAVSTDLNPQNSGPFAAWIVE